MILDCFGATTDRKDEITRTNKKGFGRGKYAPLYFISFPKSTEVEGILYLLLLYVPETKVTRNKSYSYLYLD